MNISIICALGTNRAIGRQGDLIWHVSDDLKRFKRITTGHPIIMGRKTYESIGRPLPKRTNIVVTGNKEYSADGCVIVHSVSDAYKIAGNSQGADEVFVIGGGEIYKQTINDANKLYLTIVQDAPKDADVFFPDYSEFTDIIEEQVIDDACPAYRFVTLV